MLYTVQDLEEKTQISRYTWRLWIAQRRIPVLRLGRRVRVSEEDLARFLEQNRQPAREAREQ